MASKTTSSKTFKVGRNAGTGRFVPVTFAKKHPKTNVVETMKKSGK